MIRKQKTAWKEVAWVFCLSRLIIVLVSYLTITFIPISPNHYLLYYGYIEPQHCANTIANNITCFLLSWWRWDANPYTQIAHDGYHYRYFTTFFPLFPLLMHSTGFFLGGSPLADYAAGIILANSFFYGVLVLFYKLVSKDFGHKVAKSALVYLAFAPYAIFFFAGYTESLFLLLMLAIFLFLGRGKPLDWWLAGLCGFLITLTRPTGIILTIPFLIVFVQKFSIHTLLTRENWPQKLNALLTILLTPAGLLTYMLYLWIALGNPWFFIVGQEHIGLRYFAFPWVGLYHALYQAVTGGPFAVWCLNDIVFTLGALVALILGWKQLPLRYSVLCLVMMLFVLCEPSKQDGLLSLPRFLLVLFPIYILFAIWSKDRFIAHWLFISSIIFFVTHIAVFVLYGWIS